MDCIRKHSAAGYFPMLEIIQLSLDSSPTVSQSGDDASVSRLALWCVLNACVKSVLMFGRSQV